MDRYELAWAAGFFDGEGWANAVAAEGRRTRQPQARINQADRNGVPAVLLRFQTALGGLGRLGGPYLEEGRQDLYRWEVSSRGDVELLHHLLLPWLGEVKLLELGAALARTSARSRLAIANDEWRAWAAGLYDGEGSTYLTNHRTHLGYRTAEARITQGSVGGSPEVLRRFLTVVEVGRLYGPYRQVIGHQDVYRWNASARSDVQKCMSTLWPWLGPVKRDQAEAVFAVTRSQPVLPRGREEWGRYKTHCINGHEYATARVRPYVSRGVGLEPRDSHQCLQCAREQARERRKQTKRSAADEGRRSLSEQAKRYLLK
jgi:hypothetical protein